MNTAKRDRDGLELRRMLVLVGMPGSGKSAIGRAVAAHLGVALKDSDAEIVEGAQMPIAEIFDRFGEAFFRDRESKVIARLLEGAPAVVSTGGGAWMGAENRDMILARAAVIWLDADLDLLWNRVKGKTTRPLLRTENPRQTLSDLLQQRRPVYALAPLKLTVAPEWSIDETRDALLAMLRAEGIVTGKDEGCA